MDKTRPPHALCADELHKSSLAPHIDAFTHLLTEGGYAHSTVGRYLIALRRFAEWMPRRRVRIDRIDEATVTRFLDEELPPRCAHCGHVSNDRSDASAALSHLLVVLRVRGVIAEPPVQMTAVDEELRRFDEYMDRVRGLAPKSRSMTLRTVGRLLKRRFGAGPLDIAAIKPEHVRSFFAEQSKLHRSPAGAGSVVSALRSYFYYRVACGDAMHPLIGAVSYPANWTQSSLPQTLAAEEVEQLVHALGRPGRSRRRADAIVRCALDLGLRSGEIAKLGLDDIDWRAGTITLRQTKGRREDVLPLPKATGQAIATYLERERPKTKNRAVFVRHIAPRDQAIGPDLVRKAIRQTYARAGLPHTRSHLLRHTMASRLLESGSSLKEVADVLRHRSLNTTLIYAKLDCRNLREVALAWPGRAS